VSTVQRAHAAGEGEVKQRCIRRQLEVLDRCAQRGQKPRINLGTAGGPRSLDSGGGPIEHEYVSGGPDPSGDGPGRGSRCAADLQHPQSRSKRQRVDDPSGPG
jgi:hypothetical protein